MRSSEVARLARLWLDSHGADAVALARDMIAELEESGNAGGAKLWRRVVSAIEKQRGANTRS